MGAPSSSATVSHVAIPDNIGRLAEDDLSQGELRALNWFDQHTCIPGLEVLPADRRAQSSRQLQPGASNMCSIDFTARSQSELNAARQ